MPDTLHGVEPFQYPQLGGLPYYLDALTAVSVTRSWV